MNLLEVEDLSDAIAFQPDHNLYLKPIARAAVAVRLPKSARSFSNWRIMEMIRQQAERLSLELTSFRVTRSSLEVLRLEIETRNRSMLPTIISSLNNSYLKLAGVVQPLLCRCDTAKLLGPRQHDWEAFFRDRPDLNQSLCGERPDTVRIGSLPSLWFSDPAFKCEGVDLPSVELVRQLFGKFGAIRQLEIPLLHEIEAEPERLHNGSSLTFDVYIQFQDYNGFVRCLSVLYGMKMLRKLPEDSHASACEPTLDFDREQYLSDKVLRARVLVRAKQAAERRERLEQKRRAAEEAKRQADEKTRSAQQERRARRERLRAQATERREFKRAEKREFSRLHDSLDLALEERRLVETQRRLEAMRLLRVLFEKVLDERLVEKEAESAVREALERDEERRKAEQQEDKLRGKIERKMRRHDRRQEESMRERRRKRRRSKSLDEGRS